MNLSPKQLASTLGGEATGNEVRVPGPGHTPKDRSLSIKIDPSAPEGFIAFSHAGDDPLACRDYIRDRAGLPKWQPSNSVLRVDSIARMSERVGKPVAKAGSPPATYIYELEDGAPYLRIDRPGFYQHHWNGSGWAKGAPKGPKIPYRLPELLQAEHDTVLIVEGEKDADKLVSLGLLATTNSGGAEKWTADLNQYFKGRDVYILPDNDDVGERHAAKVAESLATVAREIRIVRLPGLPPKGDVSDWLDGGGTVDELARLMEIEQPLTNQNVIYATPYAWKNPEQIARRDWLYGYLLVRKFVTATIAPGGIGKSSLIAVEALAKVSGKGLLGVSPPKQLRVWLWNLEDPQEETERKLQAAALRYKLSPEDIGDRLFVDSGRDQPLVIAVETRNGATIARPVVDALTAEIIARKIDVVIVDPFVSCFQGIGENDNVAMDMIVKEWGRVADKGNCAVHLVDHTRKMGGTETEVTVESSRGAKSKTDACRVVRAVNRMSKEEGERAGVENHRLYFRTLNDKANLQPPADKSDWFKLESVDLCNGPLGSPGDSVGVVTQWTWPDPLAGITGADFDKVARVIRAGKWRENVQASAWVGKAVAEALDMDAGNKAGKTKIIAMLNLWRTAGSLVVVEGQDEKREIRKFVEVREEA